MTDTGFGRAAYKENREEALSSFLYSLNSLDPTKK